MSLRFPFVFYSSYIPDQSSTATNSRTGHPLIDDTPHILREDLPERESLQHFIPQRIHSLPDTIALVALAAVPIPIASLGVPQAYVHVVVALVIISRMDDWEVDLIVDVS